jgi:hypothetical protein
MSVNLGLIPGSPFRNPSCADQTCLDLRKWGFKLIHDQDAGSEDPDPVSRLAFVVCRPIGWIPYFGGLLMV